MLVNRSTVLSIEMIRIQFTSISMTGERLYSSVLIMRIESSIGSLAILSISLAIINATRTGEEVSLMANIAIGLIAIKPQTYDHSMCTHVALVSLTLPLIKEV